MSTAQYYDFGPYASGWGVFLPTPLIPPRVAEESSSESYLGDYEVFEGVLHSSDTVYVSSSSTYGEITAEADTPKEEPPKRQKGSEDTPSPNGCLLSPLAPPTPPTAGPGAHSDASEPDPHVGCRKKRQFARLRREKKAAEAAENLIPVVAAAVAAAAAAAAVAAAARVQGPAANAHGDPDPQPRRTTGRKRNRRGKDTAAPTTAGLAAVPGVAPTLPPK